MSTVNKAKPCRHGFKPSMCKMCALDVDLKLETLVAPAKPKPKKSKRGECPCGDPNCEMTDEETLQMLTDLSMAAGKAAATQALQFLEMTVSMLPEAVSRMAVGMAGSFLLGAGLQATGEKRDPELLTREAFAYLEMVQTHYAKLGFEVTFSMRDKK